MTRRATPSPASADATDDQLERLKLAPEIAWYLRNRGYPLPSCPPLIKTPDPGQMPGAIFDPARVDRVLKAFSLLRHTQGQWAGTPLHPDVWEVAYIIAPVFGWVRWCDDASVYVRVVRDLYVDVPRKNGKSTLAGGIALYMTCADGEPGAQVVTAATSERQAGFVFGPLKLLAMSSPALKPYLRTTLKRIYHEPSASYIDVIASTADAQHGANIHCSVTDELHLHKKPDLVEALETGTGSRRQPLSVKITTADAGAPGTIYARKRLYVEQLALGVLEDHTTYGVVWAAETTDDPHAESTWAKANPGYGVSPTRAYLQAASNRAKQSPAELAAFLRLHLGIRTKQLTRFITLDAWDANVSTPIAEDELVGRECYGGLDLAATSDLLALCWLFPDDSRGGYDAIWRLWTPEGNVTALNRRTAGEAAVWVRDGLLITTPGNVADYGYVRAQINADRERFAVRSLGYDPWNASQLSNDLATDEVPLVKVRQGVHTLSPPLKEVQRLVLAGMDGEPLLRHGGNPAVRWMIDNLAVVLDPSGNVKPDKATSADKIDAVSALVIAMSEAMTRQPPRRSAYEESDLEVI